MKVVPNVPISPRNFYGFSEVSRNFFWPRISFCTYRNEIEKSRFLFIPLGPNCRPLPFTSTPGPPVSRAVTLTLGSHCHFGPLGCPLPLPATKTGSHLSIAIFSLCLMGSACQPYSPSVSLSLPLWLHLSATIGLLAATTVPPVSHYLPLCHHQARPAYQILLPQSSLSPLLRACMCHSNPGPAAP
jgi:hypothetical protein